MELVKVTVNDNDEQLVSARDLHNFLSISERYSSWFGRMLKYGFVENVDYVGCKTFNALARQELQDHLLKIDMAKEISMIQRTEKGKQARQYFLQVEKAWNDPEMIVQRALQIQTRKVEQLKIENAKLKPKALFSDAVRGSKNSCLIKDLATILKQNGIDIGQNRLFEWLRENGYLCSGGRRHNQPTQRSLDLAVMGVREHIRTNANGEIVTSFTPLITGKGQIYFTNKLLKFEEVV